MLYPLRKYIFLYYNLFVTVIVSRFVLLQVIHRIQSKIYFGNPDLYMEWLGTVDRRYLAYHSDLRTPLPLSVATPLPPLHVGWDRVWKW